MDGYPLGILVTTARFPEIVAGLVERSTRAGQRAGVFFTDAGVELLRDRALVSRLAGATLAACNHSAAQRRIPPVEGVTFGGQVQNCAMLRDSAHVVVL